MDNKGLFSHEDMRLAALRKLCAGTLAPEPTLNRIVELVATLFNVPISLISLVDKHRQWFRAKVGLAANETPREHAFCDHTIRHNEVLVVCDAFLDSRFKDNPLVVGEPFIRFYAGAPLRTQDGLNLGSLCVIDTLPHPSFSDQQRALLTQMAALVMAQLQALRQSGFTDRVTGLPNQSRFLEDITNILSSRNNNAPPLLLGAIDVISPMRYQNIARAVGIAHAEQFVLTAVKRLLALLLPGMTLYHLDNATFATIYSDISEPNQDGRADRLLQIFRAPIECGGIPVNTDTGIGHVQAKKGDEPPHLIRALLTALNEAHQRGCTWTIYDPAIDEAQQRSFKLLAALHEAVKMDGQLSLQYQPRVDLKTRGVVGVEALLRWQHPVFGAVSPAEFIPLAEKTALINDVTAWVIQSALEQIVTWNQTGLSIRISINVSAEDLGRGDFAAGLASALTRYGVGAEQIELEFTENQLISHPDKVQEQLGQLRKMGVEISIDDFGTGYCNMSYLKSIQATAVKIDQVFVRNLDSSKKDQIIVQAMINLAHSLGHLVVAEGVETEAAYAHLTSWGCDQVQGYLVSRPIDADAVPEWIGKWLAITAENRPAIGVDRTPTLLRLVSN